MSKTTRPTRMPVLFMGHGNPMNAIEDTIWSRAWKAWGERLPRPRAIVAVSAHWWTEGTLVTAQPKPQTIHDFGGFPQGLFAVQYPAPGAPEVAAEVAASVPGARTTTEWGLDHGTWSVLVHLFPDADIPVVQVSLDVRASPAEHLALGRALRPLRDLDILILASGNVTHNLRAFFQADSRSDRSWAERFETTTRDAVDKRDLGRLIGLEDTPDGRIAHPGPDHWRPLLVAVGASRTDDAHRLPVEGLDGGVLSMTSFEWYVPTHASVI